MGKADVTRPEAYNGNPDTISVYFVYYKLVFTLNSTINNIDWKKKAYLLFFCIKDLAAAWAEKIVGQ